MFRATLLPMFMEESNNVEMAVERSTIHCFLRTSFIAMEVQKFDNRQVT